VANPRIVRIVEIAELLGVSKQRASKIVDEPGFPTPIGREGPSRRLPAVLRSASRALG
jgi:hypothetical protein